MHSTEASQHQPTFRQVADDNLGSLPNRNMTPSPKGETTSEKGNRRRENQNNKAEGFGFCIKIDDAELILGLGPNNKYFFKLFFFGH